MSIFTGHVSVEYSFDGDVLKFHELYYGKKGEFKLKADSALTIVINLSERICLGEFRNIQICVLEGLLSDWSLPENVVFTGKIGLGNSTPLSSVVTEDD